MSEWVSQQLVRQAVSESISQSVSHCVRQFVISLSVIAVRLFRESQLSIIHYHFFPSTFICTLLISLFLFHSSYFFSLILSRFLLLNSPPIFSQCRHSCLWVLMTHHNWTPLTSLCLCGPLGETLSGSVRRPCMSKYKHSHHLHLSPIMDNII